MRVALPVRKGTGGLSKYAKLLIAQTLFEKGIAFIAAAYLLHKQARNEPQRYVALHLFAQGTELMMKGALNGVDYDTYCKSGKKIGHRLDKAYLECTTVLKLNPLPKPCAEQLKLLSDLFASHVLRYSGLQDIFIVPDSIQISLLERKAKFAIRLGRREFRKALSQ